jgi:glutathione S-transferase
VPRVVWMTGQKSVPVLVIDGKAINDSTRIIAHVEELQPEPPLYPSDPVERRRALELEEFFDEELGPHIRRVIFFETLDDGDFITGLFATGKSAPVRALYRAAYPLTRVAMRFDMGIDARRSEHSRAKVLAALDRLEAELQPSGYLVGERFSVADLTAAALFSPIVAPTEFPYPFPRPPERVVQHRESFQSRPGFRWVEEMYRRHRGTSAEVE